jgi:septal ring-binding cell division protein DamX
VADDRAAAQQILDRLKPHGGQGSFYLSEFVREDGNRFYRVRMGFYPTSEAASAAAKAVSDKANAYAGHWPDRPTEAEFKANGGKVVN